MKYPRKGGKMRRRIIINLSIVHAEKHALLLHYIHIECQLRFRQQFPLISNVKCFDIACHNI